MIRVDDFRSKEDITIKLSYAASARRRLERLVRLGINQFGIDGQLS
jgi:hypothetical protein